MAQVLLGLQPKMGCKVLEAKLANIRSTDHMSRLMQDDRGTMEFGSTTNVRARLLHRSHGETSLGCSQNCAEKSGNNVTCNTTKLLAECAFTYSRTLQYAGHAEHLLSMHRRGLYSEVTRQEQHSFHDAPFPSVLSLTTCTASRICTPKFVPASLCVGQQHINRWDLKREYQSRAPPYGGCCAQPSQSPELSG